jgi:hypothetical protein
VKENIILRAAGASETWTFPLDLQGVTPSIDANGRVVFTDPTAASLPGSRTHS